MPAIFPQMNRDAIGAGSFGERRKSNGIRLDSTANGGGRLAIACLPQGRAMIDVHAKEEHGSKKYRFAKEETKK